MLSQQYRRVAALNLRGRSFNSKIERRRLLPASLGETATSVEGFTVLFEEKAVSFFVVGVQRVRNSDGVIYMFCQFLCEDVILKCDGL